VEGLSPNEQLDNIDEGVHPKPVYERGSSQRYISKVVKVARRQNGRRSRRRSARRGGKNGILLLSALW